jgi:hypothetical protein
VIPAGHDWHQFMEQGVDQLGIQPQFVLHFQSRDGLFVDLAESLCRLSFRWLCVTLSQSEETDDFRQKLVSEFLSEDRFHAACVWILLCEQLLIVMVREDDICSRIAVTLLVEIESSDFVIDRADDVDSQDHSHAFNASEDMFGIIAALSAQACPEIVLEDGLEKNPVDP